MTEPYIFDHVLSSQKFLDLINQISFITARVAAILCAHSPPRDFDTTISSVRVSKVISTCYFGAESTILYLPLTHVALSWLTVSHDRMNHCQSRLLSFRYTPLIFPTFKFNVTSVCVSTFRSVGTQCAKDPEKIPVIRLMHM